MDIGAATQRVDVSSSSVNGNAGADAAEEMRSLSGQYQGQAVVTTFHHNRFLNSLNDAIREENLKRPKFLDDASAGARQHASDEISKKMARKAFMDKTKNDLAVNAKSIAQSAQTQLNPQQKEKVASFVNTLRQTPYQDRTKDFIRHLVKEFAGSEAEKDQILASAVEELERSKNIADGELFTLVSAIRAERTATTQNITDVADEYSTQGLGTTPELREFYRDSVPAFDNAIDTYHDILKKFGSDKFEQALKFLLNAISNDISALGPSVPPERLNFVNNQLYQIQTLGNFYRQVCSIVKDVKREFAVEEAPEGAQQPAMLVLMKIMSGPQRGTELTLSNGEYYIGAASNCDVTLTDPDVSLEHLKLNVSPSQTLFTPLSEPTYLNGAQVPKDNTQKLNTFQFITIGSTHLVFGPVRKDLWPDMQTLRPPVLTT